MGSLYALEESTLSAEVEGIVSKVLVDVGDTVSEGQPVNFSVNWIASEQPYSKCEPS